MTTIAIVDLSAQPRSAEYFGMFRSEPVLPEGLVSIDKVFADKAMTFLSLLSRISSSAARQGTILTVSHGTGGGLNFPLIPLARPAPKHGLGATEVEQLLKYVAGTIDEDTFGSSISSGDDEKELESLKQNLPLLKDLVLKVRSLKLAKWVLRSCIIGAHLDSLENLRKLLGTTVACATKRLDFFGVMRPALVAPGEFAKFIEDRHPVVDGQAPHRLAWIQTLNHTIGEVKAESTRASGEFVARNFPKGNYPGNGSFPVHAIAAGETLLFPTNPLYRKELATVGG